MTDNHGGHRKGAGRPKGSTTAEPTKMVRVPLGAEFAVKGLLSLYRQHNESSLSDLIAISDVAAMNLDVSPSQMLAFALLNGRCSVNSDTLASCFGSANAHLLPKEVALRSELLD
jgi:hypothetical protein